jgi:hypothetical protein
MWLIVRSETYGQPVICDKLALKQYKIKREKNHARLHILIILSENNFFILKNTQS